VIAINTLTVLALLGNPAPVVVPHTGHLREPNGKAHVSGEGAVVQIKRRCNMRYSRGPKSLGPVSHGEAIPGAAGPGEAFDPKRMPENSPSSEDLTKAPRAAPAPGIPLSNEQYEWLKRKAQAIRSPLSKHAQEDPSAKEPK
jgi:hypothetical protein